MGCVIQTFFDTITLLSMIGGRRTMHTTAEPDKAGKTITYTTVVETHRFFDPKLGFQYNMQSVVRICSPLFMLLASVVSYWTYHAFPDLDVDEEVAPLTGGYMGPPGVGHEPGNGNGRGVRGAPGPRLFEGSAHRLG